MSCVCRSHSPLACYGCVAEARTATRLECALSGFIFCSLDLFVYSAFDLGTTWTSHSPPDSPFAFPRLSASPNGPAELVTSLARIPFFSPVFKNSKKWTDASMYSRNATLDSSVVPVTSFMIHGTIRGASVQDGCAVPAAACQYISGSTLKLDLLKVIIHPLFTFSTIFLTTSKCQPCP